MSESVFRKKSVESLNSPEKLNTYIKSATPAIWAILAAIILFLGAVFAWIFFGCIYTRVTGVAVTEGDKVYCYARSADVYRAKSSVKVNVRGKEYDVADPKTDPIKLDPESNIEDSLVMSVGGFTTNDWICKFEIEPDIDGDFDYMDVVVITIEEISPSTFLTGGGNG